MKNNLLVQCLRSYHLIVLLMIMMLQIELVDSNRDDFNARRLYNDLMMNYNRLVRPVNSTDEDVNVSIGLKLLEFTLVSFFFQIQIIVSYDS